ncbi:MAG: hypothetical protein KDD44_07985, partial [Bdellovibrionales bacterium]|nr:hypothetical protein [Bdellovibrionales bacterium]
GLLGSAPLIVALVAVPGAYRTVTESAPLSQALSRLWDPAITNAIPQVLGVSISTYPDIDLHPGAFPGMHMPVVYFFSVVVVLALVLRAWRVLRLLGQKKWPLLELDDVCVAAVVGCLVAFTMAEFGAKPRYLLPVAWYFPLVICTLYSALPWLLRTPVALGIFAFVVLNVANSVKLIQTWMAPDYAERIPHLPDVAPLVAKLRASGITQCHSYWWLVYRITYESDESILCEQQRNQRFPTVALPYEDQFVKSEPAVFIFSNESATRIRQRDKFERALRHHQIGYDGFSEGPFKVFHSFSHQRANGLVRLASEAIDFEHFVSSGGEDVMVASFPDPISLAFVRLSFETSHVEKYPVWRIEGHDGTTWRILHSQVRGIHKDLSLLPGLPTGDESAAFQLVGFDLPRVSRLRFTRLEPGSAGTSDIVSVEAYEGLEREAPRS